MIFNYVPLSLFSVWCPAKLNILTIFTSSYQITELDKEQDIVCQMYNLINIYTIPTPPEDLAVFAILKPCITSLCNITDKSMAERDANLDKFCTSLNKEITELDNEVSNIYLKLQVSRVEEYIVI